MLTPHRRPVGRGLQAGGPGHGRPASPGPPPGPAWATPRWRPSTAGPIGGGARWRHHRDKHPRAHLERAAFRPGDQRAPGRGPAAQAGNSPRCLRPIGKSFWAATVTGNERRAARSHEISKLDGSHAFANRGGGSPEPWGACSGRFLSEAGHEVALLDIRRRIGGGDQRGAAFPSSGKGRPDGWPAGLSAIRPASSRAIWPSCSSNPMTPPKPPKARPGFWPPAA